MKPFYILTRTSGRPTFFKKCMDSVKSQTYKNIIWIVHYDNPDDKYVEGDIILYSKKIKVENERHAPYNLYFNKMMDSISENDGWFIFLDDDDKLYSSTCIEEVIPFLIEDRLNGAKAIWGDYYNPGKRLVFPDDFPPKPQISLPTQSIILHVKHKDKGRFWDKTYGDYNFTMQLGMPINWIDVVLQEQQFVKGYGKTEAEILERQNEPKKSILTSC